MISEEWTREFAPKLRTIEPAPSVATAFCAGWRLLCCRFVDVRFVFCFWNVFWMFFECFLVLNSGVETWKVGAKGVVFIYALCRRWRVPAWVMFHYVCFIRLVFLNNGFWQLERFLYVHLLDPFPFVFGASEDCNKRNFGGNNIFFSVKMFFFWLAELFEKKSHKLFFS